MRDGLREGSHERSNEMPGLYHPRGFGLAGTFGSTIVRSALPVVDRHPRVPAQRFVLVFHTSGLADDH